MVRFDWNTHGVNQRSCEHWETQETIHAPVHLLLQRNEDATQPGALGQAVSAGVAKRGERGKRRERCPYELLWRELGKLLEGLFGRDHQLGKLVAQVVELGY